MLVIGNAIAQDLAGECLLKLKENKKSIYKIDIASVLLGVYTQEARLEVKQSTKSPRNI